MKTQKSPYYAVIFTSIRTLKVKDYDEITCKMGKIDQQQEDFLGEESVREAIGITVSYWRDLESIKK